jgi:hypothetical protein
VAIGGDRGRDRGVHGLDSLGFSMRPDAARRLRNGSREFPERGEGK